MVTDCERHHGEHEPAEAVARAPERLEKLLWGGALSCDLKKEVGLVSPVRAGSGAVSPPPLCSRCLLGSSLFPELGEDRERGRSPSASPRAAQGLDSDVAQTWCSGARHVREVSHSAGPH